jgi:hypothetical protein
VKYQRQIRQALARIRKFGVAEVWWHPEAKGPVVRTGLFETKEWRDFEPELLIGRYTERHPRFDNTVSAYDLFLDIEEHVNKIVKAQPRKRRYVRNN